MDRLPLELTVKIFSELDLGDLMTLRLVCKKFEYIVREVKVRELIIKKEKPPLNNELWFLTNDLKEPSTVFSSHNLLTASAFSGGPLNVRFLKRLFVESLKEAKEIELEDINRFQYLEHLEIGLDRPKSKISSLSKEQAKKHLCEVPRLSLPNLKMLRIISFCNQNIEIDAPKLRTLELPDYLHYFEAVRNFPNDLTRVRDYRPEFWNLYFQSCQPISLLNFKQPGSVKSLSIYYLQKYAQNPNFIKRFRNVEHLLLFDWDFLRITRDLAAMIPLFKKLKRLSLCCGSLSDNVSDVARLADWVASLWRPDLKIYFLGIQITKNRNFVQDFTFYNEAFQRSRNLADEGNRCDICTYEMVMQLKNYPFLPDRIDTYFRDLHYNDLEELIKMRAYQDRESVGDDRDESRLVSHFPDDFFDRFPRIIGISAERIKNDDDFTQLVKSCKNLRSLSLKNSDLSQAFFDQLPAISLLNRLEVEETKVFNTDFLERMNHLNVCVIDQYVNPTIVLKLAKTMCRRSLYIYCEIGKRYVGIRRDASDKPRRWRLEIGQFSKVVNFKTLADYVFGRELADYEIKAIEFLFNIFFKVLDELPVPLPRKLWYSVGGMSLTTAFASFLTSRKKSPRTAVLSLF